MSTIYISPPSKNKKNRDDIINKKITYKTNNNNSNNNNNNNNRGMHWMGGWMIKSIYSNASSLANRPGLRI